MNKLILLFLILLLMPFVTSINIDKDIENILEKEGSVDVIIKLKDEPLSSKSIQSDIQKIEAKKDMIQKQQENVRFVNILLQKLPN